MSAPKEQSQPPLKPRRSLFRSHTAQKLLTKPRDKSEKKASHSSRKTFRLPFRSKPTFEHDLPKVPSERSVQSESEYGSLRLLPFRSASRSRSEFKHDLLDIPSERSSNSGSSDELVSTSLTFRSKLIVEENSPDRPGRPSPTSSHSDDDPDHVPPRDSAIKGRVDSTPGPAALLAARVLGSGEIPALEPLQFGSPIHMPRCINEVLSTEWPSPLLTRQQTKQSEGEIEEEDNTKPTIEVPHKSPLRREPPTNIDDRLQLENLQLGSADNEHIETDTPPSDSLDTSITRQTEPHSLAAEDQTQQTPQSAILPPYELEGSTPACTTTTQRHSPTEMNFIGLIFAHQLATDRLNQHVRTLGQKHAETVEGRPLIGRPIPKTKRDDGEHSFVSCRGAVVAFAVTLGVAALARVCMKVK